MLVKFTGAGSAQLTLNGKPYLFMPTANVPDEEGAALVSDEVMGKQFVAVGETPPSAKSTNPLACVVCGKVCGSLAGLGSHKRKHKEIT